MHWSFKYTRDLPPKSVASFLLSLYNFLIYKNSLYVLYKGYFSGTYLGSIFWLFMWHWSIVYLKAGFFVALSPAAYPQVMICVRISCVTEWGEIPRKCCGPTRDGSQWDVSASSKLLEGVIVDLVLERWVAICQVQNQSINKGCSKQRNILHICLSIYIHIYVMLRKYYIMSTYRLIFRKNMT